MMKRILNKVVFYVGNVFYPVKNERGATAVEYALMVALIAVAIIAAVMALTGGLNGIFGRITAALGAA